MRLKRPRRRTQRRTQPFPWLDLLDWLAIFAWGSLLLHYWLSGHLSVLLHPNFRWLSNSAAILLLVVSAVRGWQLFQQVRRRRPVPSLGHQSLLPRQVSSGLLVAIAIFGFFYTPRAFASETALQRGVTETLGMTRGQPQQFVRSGPPEDRTIIDWVRTLHVYPEPDAYADQAVSVSGFVIHPPDWPDNYLMLSRFVITCCAADAYPVGLPVEIDGSRSDYPADTWLQVEGRMATDAVAEQRQLVIQPSELTEIPEPDDPYAF